MIRVPGAPPLLRGGGRGAAWGTTLSVSPPVSTTFTILVGAVAVLAITVTLVIVMVTLAVIVWGVVVSFSHLHTVVPPLIPGLLPLGPSLIIGGSKLLQLVQ